jgi:Putative peptidoglycan binding domain
MLPRLANHEHHETAPGTVDRRGPAYIRWVQQALNQVSAARLTVDGAIGTRTRAAIRAFQAGHRLPADGVAGPRTEQALIAAGASPPPGASATPLPMPSTPSARLGALIKREDQPPGTTLYLDIRLGGERPARPMTGVFIPAGYRPQPQIDLVVYLHGHKSQHPRVAIDEYWNLSRFPYWPLREELNVTGKNVVLVAPTLGPRAEAGGLVRPGGLDTYLNQVLAALREYGPYKNAEQAPEIGSIILACHSGGGYPMRQLVGLKDRAAARIRECWAFDCLYNRGDPQLWASWARARPDARLFVHYQISTAPNSQQLQRMGLPNVAVERSPNEHNRIPIAHWQQRLQAAGFLQNR